MDSKFFTYGNLAMDILFTGREEELRELQANIRACQNTIIYGLRRVGKSSLIHEAIKKHLLNKSNKKDVVLFFDLSRVVNSKQFLILLAKEISKVLDKTKPIEQNLKKLTQILKSLRPTAKVNSITGELEHSLDFIGSTETIAESISEALQLLEQLKEKNNRIIVVFDEFQGIVKWDDNQTIQWQIRSVIQSQKNIIYIFSGSSKTLIEKIFMEAKSAFYRSGSIIYLKNYIELESLVPWMKSRFQEAGLTLTPEALTQILEITKAQPYYTQKLCYKICVHKLNNKKSNQVSFNDVNQSIKKIIEEESFVNKEKLDDLTYNQQNSLVAIAKLNQSENKATLDAITDLTNISKPSVQTALKSLERSETQLIFKEAKEYFIEDPFFRLWLETET